ncbi:putative receptor-like protein kinase At5g39000 [Lotus japonicus]|uniref:putative receptor-like protein kinase At5g39000 n=1 Tax=Lotus japonicus TaxID=34305 RepID=UPI00258C65CE|nr:putative receptor-like protein kinase At5g39000 [Lotus japonicus]
MRLITPTLLYFSLSLVIHSTYLEAYDPVDLFTIDCGSSGFYLQEQDNDGRTWHVDRYYTGELILTGESDNASANTLAPFINQIPYGTARLSRSQFNFSFPVNTAGPKFLRLFFYPASYSGGFNRGDASFTVKSNGFTLLKDINASLTADAEGLDTIFREYIINVNHGQNLDLYFTPTTSSSYAFINGIEVVSMPSDLYYTPSTDPGFKLVGRDNTLYSVANNTALETSYRIKVGGQTISPSKDTGLFRNWEGNDDLYLRTPSALGSEEADSTGAMNITVSPDYAAPEDVTSDSTVKWQT